jgi:hypothetical protein
VATKALGHDLGNAGRAIDAAGRLVLPGGIEVALGCAWIPAREFQVLFGMLRRLTLDRRYSRLFERRTALAAR